MKNTRGPSMTRDGRRLGPILAAGVLLGLFVVGPGSVPAAADTEAGPPPGSERAIPAVSPGGVAAEAADSEAEQAGWKLFFHDDFQRHELGPDWMTVDGAWTVTNGCLRGSGTLISARAFPAEHPPGYQRLEFDAATDVQPFLFPNQPKPKVVVSDLGGFIHAQPPDRSADPLRSGYFFQFGGMNNTTNRLLRKGVAITGDGDSEHLIVQGRTHHVVLENDKGVLRCRVDGRTILESRERQSVFGEGYDRVGLCLGTVSRVFNVKVYVKRLPSDLDLD